MLIVTPEQMAAIDRETLEIQGMSGLLLMEIAARSVLSHLPEGRTTILVGPGNNGGDGLVIARALFEAGRPVLVLAFSKKGSKEWETNRELAQGWGVPIVHPEVKDLPEYFAEADVLVDALFGIGLDRPIEGNYAAVIEHANMADCVRVSIDIPSGINGKTGQVMGTAFVADRTITFGHPKWGHVLHPGYDFTGEMFLSQSGFHPEALAKPNLVGLTDADITSECLPLNWRTMHKGDNGRLLLCTGSDMYPGAGILSALGALRGGAGYVTHWAPESLRTTLNTVVPEALLLNRDESPKLPTFDALVIGSGLGEMAKGLSPTLLREFKGPIVVDADSLPWALKVDRADRSNFVLTPHPGEMARLLDCSVADVEQNRIETALKAAADLGCVVCLKGAPTVTASPDGRALINMTGNPVLAQGGSGDVLAGLLGAYLAFGIPIFEAAVAAAHIHGLAADMAVAESGPRGLPATRVAEFIPMAYADTIG